MQRGASLGRAMVSLATRGAPAHLARARSGATATTSSLTRASSHNGARHHAAWSLQPSHPTPRPPHRATRGRPSSPPVVARSSTTDSTSTSAIKGDRVTLPPPGDVHLWIMDPADATDPAAAPRGVVARATPAPAGTAGARAPTAVGYCVLLHENTRFRPLTSSEMDVQWSKSAGPAFVRHSHFVPPRLLFSREANFRNHNLSNLLA